ncbi:PREDICTED: uncharacterized protein LOC101311253 [Fragaria vesca subsp. vesca]|uniref:uncharacterized protein LOC101311253 n=1 Tax=Fragaria vesca subsp. vesca TaxID=101020 RepID=UPI0002C2EE74|nr:PREDICTED: uncharacterized protein LOC101311253 [Fragaria vesca subsp. vesca]
MGDLEKQQLNKDEAAAEETERLVDDGGMAVLDFDMLCSTVALQTQGKSAAKFQSFDGGDEAEAAELGGVFRMWEGELLDCFEDRRVALESACCPCYTFGKNMKRAGFGPCFLQGSLHLILVASILLNCVAFIITKKRCFVYLVVAFTITLGTYLGYFRTQIRNKFNIRGNESSVDDCLYHLVCPCCTLSQEARTLEMNNVQDGTWHGRGDTIYIGSLGEGGKSFFELQPPTLVSIKSPDLCNTQKSPAASTYS